MSYRSILKCATRLPQSAPVRIAANAYHEWRVLRELAHDALGLRTGAAFDTVYREGCWDFEGPIECERYERTLSAVEQTSKRGQFGDVLEIGCSYGVFTEQLSARSRVVTACDCSSVALEQAAKRCASCVNVRFLNVNLLNVPITGQYDAVFSMDVLDYIYGRQRTERVLRNLWTALRDGGLLVISTFRVPVRMQKRSWARLRIPGDVNRAFR